MEDEERVAGHSRAGRDAYDVGRVLAFSDGVFAIAITLLVLTIPIPSVPSNSGNREMWSALVSVSPHLLGFAISFAVVGNMWLGHHRLLRRLERIDTRTVLLNLLLLFFICLLPFSTGVLVRSGDLAVAVDLYAANVALSGLTFGGLWIHLQRHPSLLQPGAAPANRLVYARTLTPTVVFLISIPMAWLSSTAAYVCWLLLIPVSAWLNRHGDARG